MSSDQAGSLRVAALRDEFDQSFALPPRLPHAVTVDVLDVSIGGQPYGLYLRELAGLHGAIPITPLPSGVAELIGLAQFGTRVLPVYDLGALVGHAARQESRHIVVAAGAPIGLAIDRFERHVRTTPDRIVPHASFARTATGHAREVLELDGVTRPLLSLSSILDDILARATAAAPSKDHHT